MKKIIFLFFLLINSFSIYAEVEICKEKAYMSDFGTYKSLEAACNSYGIKNGELVTSSGNVVGDPHGSPSTGFYYCKFNYKVQPTWTVIPCEEKMCEKTRGEKITFKFHLGKSCVDEVFDQCMITNSDKVIKNWIDSASVCHNNCKYSGSSLKSQYTNIDDPGRMYAPESETDSTGLANIYADLPFVGDGVECDGSENGSDGSGTGGGDGGDGEDGGDGGEDGDGDKSCINGKDKDGKPCGKPICKDGKDQFGKECTGTGTEGEGNGSQFGGSCGAYTCNGDAAACAIAKATSDAACALTTNRQDSKVLKAKSEFDSAFDGTDKYNIENLKKNAEKVNVGSFDSAGSGWSRSCPKDVDIPLGFVSQSLKISFHDICGVLGILSRVGVAITLLGSLIYVVKK